VSAKRTINKAACKRLAGEVRAELGLDAMHALDPWQLAELYGVRVLALGDLPLDHEVRDHFHNVRPHVFSGALLPHRNGALIIENDSHPLARRRSTMGHEMAHVIGEHKFGTSLVHERGCRTADKFQEDEAAEISGELLVPSDAARRLARQKATDDEVALRFGVSVELARWRMNATGARIIAQRAANYRRASGN
jgi:Zn-dependent peptidase ImmA (M78 family)